MPVFMFLIAICIVKAWFASMVSPFFGKTNFADGIAVVAAMRPIGAPLHEPVLICVPFVRGRLDVAQKLMKLFSEVAEATWPASASLCGHQHSGRSCHAMSRTLPDRPEQNRSERGTGRALHRIVRHRMAAREDDVHKEDCRAEVLLLLLLLLPLLLLVLVLELPVLPLLLLELLLPLPAASTADVADDFAVTVCVIVCQGMRDTTGEVLR